MEKNKTLLKICGIRSVEEMEELKGLDIDYVGCIFAKSPRQVNIEIASQIVKIVHKNEKKVVGVFVNAMIRDIVRIVETLKIDVVQLHGNETAEYCEELRKALERIHKNYLNDLKNDVKSIKDKTVIWKSFAVKNKLPNINDYKSFIEYPLFETKGEKAGGNGKTFNWQILKEVSPYSFILAGGISTENVEAAISYRPAVVDVNSKVEIDNRKNKKLVEKIIEIVKS
nr:phosphoribosylanthranilate isomerase [uncultured Leptotrichia sp.]